VTALQALCCDNARNFPAFARVDAVPITKFGTAITNVKSWWQRVRAAAGYRL